MANHKSAIKRIRSTARKRMNNRVVLTRTRNQVKKARTALEDADLDAAIEETQSAISSLDRAASKGVMHKNAAARRKSSLMKQLAELKAQKSA